MMPSSLTTPVLFLIFNRPETTRAVFEQIRKAKPQRLYIAADGPRAGVPTDAGRCSEAREILAHVNWPCDVQTLLRAENLGCKRAVSSALDWFFENESEGIILEDDCLPGNDFFLLCQSLLAKYRTDERVMMISGTNHLQGTFTTTDSYVFSRYFNIWGWASWKRVWEQYDVEMRDWKRKKKERALDALYSHKGVKAHLTKTFNLTYEGGLDTWDAQLFFRCAFSGGISIVPKVNLISNIGVAGTHSDRHSPNNFTPVFPLDTSNLVHPRQVQPNEEFDAMMFDQQFTKSLLQRALLIGKELLHHVKQLRRKRR